MRSLGILLLLLVVIGCSRRAGDSPTPDKGPTPEKGGQPKSGGNEGALEDEIQKMAPVEPVAFDKLVALLPPAPTGFQAEEPRGEKIVFGEFKHSFAERDYRSKKEGDEKRIAVKIHDAAHIKELYSAIAISSKLTIESTDGYTKGVKIDGDVGFETYKKANQSGELTMMVGKRHLVIVAVSGAPAELLRTVYQSIDRKALAALK